jgi:hypothetical protein
MTMLNIPLLQNTMAFIEADPDCYDGKVWGISGNSRIIADFAGWATMLQDPNQRPPRGRLDKGDGTWIHERHWTVKGIWMPAHASRILGLDFQQRAVLFDSRWGVRALRAGVNGLVRSNGGIGAFTLTKIMEDENVDWDPAGHTVWP